MSPGYITTSTRGGALYASRLGGFARHTVPAAAPMTTNFGQHAGRRTYDGPRQRFVLVDNEDGSQTIETGASEVITITPLEAGGVEIAIEPAEVAEPAPAEPMPVL